MEKEIIWSPTAIKSFSKVIDYLQLAWTNQEVFKFVSKTEKVLSLIASNKVKFRSAGVKDLREVLITKHNLLIYRIKHNRIEILRFYDTRQNPKRKKF